MTAQVQGSRAPLRAAFRFFARLFALAVAFATASGSVHALTQPKWAQLSPDRQEALRPLAGQWDKLDDARRGKWILVADRYPTMSPVERKRLQTRMADWARLTPEERRAARETYQKTRTVPPEQKKAQWVEYQSLPDAQKQQLAASVEQKKPARQKAQQREREGKVARPGTPPTRGRGAPTAPTAIPPAPAQAPVQAMPVAAPAPPAAAQPVPSTAAAPAPGTPQ